MIHVASSMAIVASFTRWKRQTCSHQRHLFTFGATTPIIVPVDWRQQTYIRLDQRALQWSFDLNRKLGLVYCSTAARQSLRGGKDESSTSRADAAECLIDLWRQSLECRTMTPVIREEVPPAAWDWVTWSDNESQRREAALSPPSGRITQARWPGHGAAGSIALTCTVTIRCCRHLLCRGTLAL